jgi:hypothetical protein
MTEIELAALVEQYTGLTDQQSPAYAQAYRLAHAVMTASAVPDGWQLVPIEPTEDMVIHGFESAPHPCFGNPEDWDDYEEMSGCQQAAHRAKLCWAAMLASIPETWKELPSPAPEDDQ